MTRHTLVHLYPIRYINNKYDDKLTKNIIQQYPPVHNGATERKAGDVLSNGVSETSPLGDTTGSTLLFFCAAAAVEKNVDPDPVE